MSKMLQNFLFFCKRQYLNESKIYLFSEELIRLMFMSSLFFDETFDVHMCIKLKYNETSNCYTYYTRLTN